MNLPRTTPGAGRRGSIGRAHPCGCARRPDALCRMLQLGRPAARVDAVAPGRLGRVQGVIGLGDQLVAAVSATRRGRDAE